MAYRDLASVVTMPADDVAWQEDMYSLASAENEVEADVVGEIPADDGTRAQEDTGDRSELIWNTVDIHWAHYEQLLPDAIAGLSRIPRWCTYPAEPWLRVLVPFIAGLLVRGPDFHDRHNSRIPDVGIFGSTGNSNSARLAELTRLLAPICAARWTYLTFEDGAELITSDRGYAWVCYPWGEVGIVVPVSPSAALIIEPRQERLVLRASETAWFAQLSSARQSVFDADALNRAIARSAFTLIAGPNHELIRRYVPDLVSTTPNFREPYSDAWPPSRVRRLHETDWHRLVSITYSAPSDDPRIPITFADFGDAVYRRGRWASLILFPLNYPAYGTGLRKRGGLVWIRLLSSEQANAIHAEAISRGPDSAGYVEWWT